MYAYILFNVILEWPPKSEFERADFSYYARKFNYRRGHFLI